ncbi:MAG: biotin--[acetyl-CoA-carboxylase] ligase [Nitrosomonadaceae bacterium]
MKSLTFPVLRLLNDGEFHSGVTIARDLGVSRASVSLALRGVEEFGLVVNKVHGRGYRLPEGLQWLDRELILTHLGQEARAFHLEILDTVESTNSLLLQRSSIKKNAGELSIAVLATELQTGGRGRRGREWHSGLGDGLTFSLVWRFQQGANLLSGLSLAVGVAIARVLRSSGVEDAALKWPNDVLIDGRKIAGILIELQGDMLGPTTAVIGIGINLKLSDSVKDRIDQSATDLYSVNGKTPDRNHLMAALLLELTRVLKDFECHGFAPFREEWVRYHAFENQSVQLQMPDGSLQEGLVRGVGEDGSLILSTPLGDRIYNGGEISLRKVS